MLLVAPLAVRPAFAQIQLVDMKATTDTSTIVQLTFPDVQAGDFIAVFLRWEHRSEGEIGTGPGKRHLISVKDSAQADFTRLPGYPFVSPNAVLGWPGVDVEYKVATGTGPETITITYSEDATIYSTTSVTHAYQFRGVHPTNPIDAHVRYDYVGSFVDPIGNAVPPFNQPYEVVADAGRTDPSGAGPVSSLAKLTTTVDHAAVISWAYSNVGSYSGMFPRVWDGWRWGYETFWALYDTGMYKLDAGPAGEIDTSWAAGTDYDPYPPPGTPETGNPGVDHVYVDPTFDADKKSSNWISVAVALTPTTAGTPPDTAPPVISGTTTVPSATDIRVTWSTDESATGTVQYGLTSGLELPAVSQAGAGVSHSVTLSSLTPDTTYFLRVVSQDASGNVATTETLQVRTTAAPDTAPPIISNTTTVPGATTIAVTWSTGEPASGTLEYGLTSSFELPAVSEAGAGAQHSLTLSGLTPDTTYLLRLVCRDAAGNVATSPTIEVRTLPPADTTPPVITGLAAMPGSSTADGRIELVDMAGLVIQADSYTIPSATQTIDENQRHPTSFTVRPGDLILIFARWRGYQPAFTVLDEALYTRWQGRYASVIGSDGGAYTHLPGYPFQSDNWVLWWAGVDVLYRVIPEGHPGQETVTFTFDRSGTQGSFVQAYQFRGQSRTTPILDHVRHDFVGRRVDPARDARPPFDAGFRVRVDPGRTHADEAADGLAGGSAFSSFRKLSVPADHAAVLVWAYNNDQSTMTPGMWIRGWDGPGTSAWDWGIVQSSSQYETAQWTVDHGLATAEADVAFPATTTWTSYDPYNGAPPYPGYPYQTSYAQRPPSPHSFTVDKTSSNWIAIAVALAPGATGQSAIRVTWTTDEPATGTVQYGRTSSLELPAVSEAGVGLQHGVTLAGLAPDTTYFVRVVSQDAAGNVSTSQVAQVRTAAAADTTAPVISSLTAVPGATDIRVAWSTGESATGTVQYGRTSGFELPAVTEGGVGLSHELTLAGLAPDTVYFVRVVSQDAAGNVATSQTFQARTTASAAPGTFVSDNFNSPPLSSALWTVTNPRGDASVSTNGTQLVIDLPAGASHDLWSGDTDAPRVMQSVTDGDLEIVAKFDSAFTGAYQMQGLLVEQDSATFLRFDFVWDGSRVNVFAASFTNAQPTVRYSAVAWDAGSRLWLGVKRVGARWTQRYSLDGTTWIAAGDFLQTLTVTRAGVFAGNAGFAPPAFRALVDYAFDPASPVAP
jgi:hypothetical protein